MLPRQMTGQNCVKILEMLINISKIVSWDPHANESNFEKIEISHVNGDANSEETSLAKELALVILKLWC